MEFFSSPDLWIAFVTLLLLEIVLGIDNVVFISILADKLPAEQRRKARMLGLSLAMVFRIGLLLQPPGSSASLRRCAASDHGMHSRSADETSF
jgi:hypothetical protein